MSSNRKDIEMAFVYIWENTPTEPGHASLETSNAYISYWPSTPANKKDFKIGQTHEAAFPSSYRTDWRLEGKECDHKVYLSGLNEVELEKQWQKFKNDAPKYNMVKHNCSTVIATMLEIGSNIPPPSTPTLNIEENHFPFKFLFKLRYLGNYIDMWTPNTVWQYALHIEQNMP